jgi:hypothetical protein
MGADLTYLTYFYATRRQIVGVGGAYAWFIELVSSLILLPFL